MICSSLWYNIDGLDPAQHYVIVGEQMGVAPSEGFDPIYYRERYPDVSREVTASFLGHYLRSGRMEGRRPVDVAADLIFDRSLLDENRDTVLLVSHEASRTGAPILVYNIARQLRDRYNVVVVLLAGGALVADFEATCAAVVGPLSYNDWLEHKYLVKRLVDCYGPLYAIVNSIASRGLLPAFALLHVPTVTLVHEFASGSLPKKVMVALDWSTQVVFSAKIVLESALKGHPTLLGRPVHILAQGQCDLPPARDVAAGPYGRARAPGGDTAEGD